MLRAVDLYVVVGEVEEGVLRLPSEVQLWRLGDRVQPGVNILVESAMSKHKQLAEVPKATKAGFTLGGYDYDRGSLLRPRRVPNIFDIQKGDRLVSP